MRILLVEDEPKLASFIKKGFAEESFDVEVARDGEEALERARRTAYDLVILDLMLPRMDEFAVCSLMRHAGQVVTRTMIAEQVWGFNWDRLTNVIDVYINHLRNKIEVSAEPRLIHAVRGAGYVIREPDATG